MLRYVVGTLRSAGILSAKQDEINFWKGHALAFKYDLERKKEIIQKMKIEIDRLNNKLKHLQDESKENHRDA